ncbi:MAG: IS66 family transposase, partial [Clostridiaceae bacterium]|nr:IS66 family transposase [Clostridiaceae bacterium]
MAKSSKDIQLSELKDLISQLNTTIKNLNETISQKQQENDNLKAEMAWLKQKLFG